MKVKELRNLSGEELLTKKIDFNKELFNLRCQIGLCKLENLARVKTIKRDVARIETIIKEGNKRKA